MNLTIKNTFTKRKIFSASGTVYDYPSSQLASKAGLETARNANLAGGSWSNSNVYDDKRIGVDRTERTYSSIPFQEGTWNADWSSTYTAYQSQVLLTFEKPAEINASNLGSATLTIKTNSADTLLTNISFLVCSPASSSSNEPTNFTNVDSSLFQSTKTEFTGTGASGQTYTFTITNRFKQCLSTGKYWLVVTPSETNLTGKNYARITEVTLTYTLSYTKATAPSSINVNTSSVLPSNNVTISWSGASGGTNNSITGYTLYYKSGSAPTTSSYTGKSEISSTNSSASYNFQMPSTRGTTYYFKVVTKGSAGSTYYSDISSTQVIAKTYNTPATPSFTTSSSRVKTSGNTTINVTVDTSYNSNQNIKYYYALTATDASTPTNWTEKSKSFSLTATNTNRKIWIKVIDGGSDSAYNNSINSKVLSVNVKPSISSHTMTASGNNYAIINCNAKITKGSGTFSYKWYFYCGSNSTNFKNGNNLSATSTITQTNYNVSALNIFNLGQSIYLKLEVTDDLGEQVTSQTAAISLPTVPTINIYNNKSGNTYNNIGNASHFGNYLYIVEARATSGFTRILKGLASDVVITGQNYEVNLSSKADYGKSYTLRVLYQYGNKEVYATIGSGTDTSKIYTRVKNYTPVFSSASSSTIKPYTATNFLIEITGQPTNFSSTNDVTGTISEAYNVYFKNGNNTLSLSCSYSNSSGTVTIQPNLSNITTTQWKNLFNLSIEPCVQKTASLVVEIKTLFTGVTFSTSKTINLNFIENIEFNGSTSWGLKILTTSNSYVNVPNNYTFFEGETLRFVLPSGTLRVYGRQKVTITLKDNRYNKIVTGTIANNSSNWTLVSGNNHKYQYNNDLILTYTVPAITRYATSTNSRSNETVTFSIVTTAENTTHIDKSIQNNYFARIDSNAIINNLIFNLVEKNGNTDIKVTFSDLGSVGSVPYISNYSKKIIKFTYSSNPKTIGTVINNEFTIAGATVQSTDGFINSKVTNVDVAYIGAKIILEPNLEIIGTYTPKTTKTQYNFDIINKCTYYATVPNLLYGKNFFVMNASAPKSSNYATRVDDQLLVIRPNKNRKVIYIGEDGSETSFTINSDGLYADGGSW